jgi:hypothetical protein
MNTISIISVEDLNNLDTGDILLFRGDSIFGRFLEFFGRSKYSHVGIILKNPKFLNECLEDGIYILESSSNNTPDSEDHMYKIGVQIHKLEDVVNEYNKGCVYVRKLNCIRDETFYKKLNDIHTEIHNKPYDINICDWIVAKYNLDKNIAPNPLYKTTKDFWCSALVCFIFKELGFIKDDVNWTIMAPREFSSIEGKYIKFDSSICKVDNERLLY